MSRLEAAALLLLLLLLHIWKNLGEEECLPSGLSSIFHFLLREMERESERNIKLANRDKRRFFRQ